MSLEYFKETFSPENPLPPLMTNALFENCLFTSYDFKVLRLAHARFIDCTFKNCDLSNVSLANTRLRSCSFETCKILGVQWIHCLDFTAPSFNECNLSYGNFTGLNLKKNQFTHSNLSDVDFSGADLSECNFTQSDFLNTRFQDTILIKANFQGAFNYLIDPIHNKVKGAKFSLPEATGLLKGFGVVIN